MKKGDVLFFVRGSEVRFALLVTNEEGQAETSFTGTVIAVYSESCAHSIGYSSNAWWKHPGSRDGDWIKMPQKDLKKGLLKRLFKVHPELKEGNEND